MSGWISLHRQITENWMWEDKPFSYGQAWIDMLLMANHCENKIPIGDQIITVEAGSFITSQIKLMERWGWSKTKLLRFFKLLKSDEMIEVKTDRKKTTISIVNWGNFQCLQTTEKPKKDQKKTNERPIKNQSETDKRPIKDTNNNDNNDNNDNNIILAHSDEKRETESLDEFFNRIWKLYPLKKGKGQVSKTKKKVLQKIGYEHLTRCVERYVEDVKLSGKYMMHGSTFFNSGYVDFLDENYEIAEHENSHITNEFNAEEELVGDDW